MTCCDMCHAPAERIVQRADPPNPEILTCTGDCLATLRRACAEAGVRIHVHDLIHVELDRPWATTDLGVSP